MRKTADDFTGLYFLGRRAGFCLRNNGGKVLVPVFISFNMHTAGVPRRICRIHPCRIRGFCWNNAVGCHKDGAVEIRKVGGLARP